VTIDEAVERKAAHDNQQQAVLRELQYAHQVILAAVAIMTPGQKMLWATANAKRGVPGQGTTRFHERAVAIFNATGEC
jgi:hypothetical protein